MLTTSANYNTYNVSSGGKKPRVIITFDGIAGTKFCSGSFGDWTSTYKKYIVDCEYVFAKIDPFNSKWESGGATFTLLDYNDEVTSFLNSNAVEGLKITIKHGFEEIDEADFSTLPPVWVKEVRLLSDLLTYKFFCTDIFDKIDNDIFRKVPFVTLSEDESNSSTTWNVTSTSGLGFTDPTSLPTGVPSAALICENEAVKYTADNGTDFTVDRAEWGTVGTAHTTGRVVKQGWNLDGNFAEILLRILTTTASGTNGDYDLGFKEWGLEIDDDYVNIEQIEREGWRYHAGNRNDDGLRQNYIDWVVHDTTNAKEFITKYLLKPFNAILYLDEDGKICLKVQDYIREINDFTNNDLNKSDIKSNPTVETLNENLINRIRIKAKTYPIKSISESQLDVPIWKFDDSVTNYGSTTPIEIVSLDNIGTNGLLAADGYKQHHSYRYFLYFGNLLQKITLGLQPHNWVLMPNDTVRLTHDKIPDISAGTRGWTNKKGIVLSNRVDLITFDSSFCEIMFLGGYDKVTSMYTLSKVTAGFDRAAVQYSATSDTTLEAEDGYWDDGDPGDGSEYYVKLTITPPGGTDAEQWIDICVRTLYAGPTWNAYNYRIRYNSSWSSAFNVWLFGVYWNDPYSPGTVTRLKVDWYGASDGGGDRPSSIAISEIWKVKFDKDISEE